ncbi:hypothetical protein X975_20979, partial [Stegodyphus mimosarum]
MGFEDQILCSYIFHNFLFHLKLISRERQVQCLDISEKYS